MVDSLPFQHPDEAFAGDIVGSSRACIFDGLATIVNDDHAVRYCWYDNEFGYNCQVVR